MRNVLILSILLTTVYILLHKHAPEVKSVRTKIAQLIHPRAAKSTAPMVAKPIDPNQKWLKDYEDCSKKLIAESRPVNEFLAINRHTLENSVGSWYFDKSVDPKEASYESSNSGLFLAALAESHLLQDRELPYDPEAALKNLDQVIQKDPTNSAPILFEAILQKNLGNQEAAENLLKRLKNTTHYDSYLKSINHLIFSLVNQPRDYMAAVDLWAQAPVPDMTPLRRLLRERKLTTIAAQMLSDGLKASLPLTDLDWIPVEYGVGYAIFRDLGHPEAYPDTREMYHQAQFLRDHLEQSMAKNGKYCTLDDLRPEIEEARRHLRY